MDKSTYFYHASLSTSLTVLEPRSEKRPHDFTHGQVVWATPSLAFATEFIVPGDDTLTRGGAFGETCYLIIGDREKYEKLDCGGAVYILPRNSFRHYQKHEWYSVISVTPIDKIVYPSGLRAMLENGVQVFFLNKNEFAQIKAGTDHLDLIRNLQSENQRQNMNVIPI